MLDTINMIIGILFIPVVFLSPVTLLIGIIMIISSFFDKDEIQKKKIRKRGFKFVIITFGVAFILLTLYGLSSLGKAI